MNLQRIRYNLRFGDRRPSKRRVVWLHPTSVARLYNQALQAMIEDWHQRIVEWLPEQLKVLLVEQAMEMRQDSVADTINRVLEALKLRLSTNKLNPETLLADIGQRTSRWNDQQWQKTLKNIMGVNISLREPWLITKLRSFTDENLTLIKSLKGSMLEKTEQVVRRGLAVNKRHEVIMQELIDDLGVTKNRARLIARDQVSKLNGELTAVRQQDVGVTTYTWETSDDSRVRGATKTSKSHRVLDGKVCSWQDSSVYFDEDGKTWKKRTSIQGYVGIPGQDFQCRCWANPIFED
jgi:SPP1 gp7 family putative phage head morphogenesis protein